MSTHKIPVMVRAGESFEVDFEVADGDLPVLPCHKCKRIVHVDRVIVLVGKPLCLRCITWGLNNLFGGES